MNENLKTHELYKSIATYKDILKAEYPKLHMDFVVHI